MLKKILLGMLGSTVAIPSVVLAPILLSIEYRGERCRRKEEEIAYNISYDLGKIVETKNNVERSFDNFTESNPVPILKRIIENTDKLNQGDHVYIQYPFFTHHGLYVGNGFVIHYLRTGVQYDTIEKFSEGQNIYVRDSLKTYSINEIIARATRRIGECKYNVLTNNCEQFVLWCRAGI